MKKAIFNLHLFYEISTLKKKGKIMSIQSVGRSVINLCPPLAERLLGNCSAAELAGVVRVTAEKLNYPQILKPTTFKSGKNFAQWFNNKFLRCINPMDINARAGIGINENGLFTENVRRALNKTGCTLGDFAQFVQDSIKLSKFVDEKSPISVIFAKRLRQIAQKTRSEQAGVVIDTPMKAIDLFKTTLSKYSQEGGSIGKLREIVCKRLGISVEKVTSYSDKMKKVFSALYEAFGKKVN